jgi:tRNA pseudouridine32 synthase/23S rRNA pseudouridine746 synthase
MFQIIYQNNDFIVISKNENINFHDEGLIGQGLFSQVKSHLNNINNAENSSSNNLDNELYPVHRLDKMTSGLVIFAKNKSAAQIFGELFSNHLIEKYYLAVSDKKPSKKQGLISGDMAKSRRGAWKLLRSMKKPAITQFFSYSIGDSKRLYLLKPHSGKTHQLRVALSSIGSPILGDELYHGKTLKPIDRGYLHAYALKFSYLNEQYEIIAPPTSGVEYLLDTTQEVIERLNKPWLVSWPKVKG